MPQDLLDHFNPNLVRFKHLLDLPDRSIKHYFNPNLVRFKRAAPLSIPFMTIYHFNPNLVRFKLGYFGFFLRHISPISILI